MSIRATTGPGASSPTDLNNSSNYQKRPPQQIGAGALGLSAVVSIVAITPVRRGGDQQ
jgi:hypothetical protein